MTVYSISGDGRELKVSHSNDKTCLVNLTKPNPFEIELSKCGLYEVNLEVLDTSGEGNSRVSRRFVLFDNSSNVLKN